MSSSARAVLRLAAVAAAVLLVAACARRDPLRRPSPKKLNRAAPDSFRVAFETSRGTFTVMAHRAWSPKGVDRFYYLVKHGYYTENRFFRVVPNFVVQWGIAGDSATNAAWNRTHLLPDEPVKRSNLRGTMSYARGGPNTRSHQLFVNVRDNARLDTSGTFGFPPIAQVVEGMSVVDSMYAGYNGPRGPNQDSIRLQGNAYLTRAFPKLDYIRRARVMKEWD